LLVFWLLSFLIQPATQPAPPPPGDPLIVRIIEPPSDPTGLAEVLLGVVRLTGVWVLVAVVLGAALAYGLFWLRSKESSGNGQITR
jgi:hypothetical protein